MILLKQKLPRRPGTQVRVFGQIPGFIALIVAALIVSIGLILEYVDGGDLWKEAKFQFLVAIAIFVAIVPEGLPIILVTTLAIGMRNMARIRR